MRDSQARQLDSLAQVLDSLALRQAARAWQVHSVPRAAMAVPPAERQALELEASLAEQACAVDAEPSSDPPAVRAE